MPWANFTVEKLREEFVALSQDSGVSMMELCRRFGISPKTGYKWLSRYKALGPEGLTNQSRRPRHIFRQTPQEPEDAVCALRRQHPAWGARKIRRRLRELGKSNVPACSTITQILRRNGLLGLSQEEHRGPWQRFEYPTSNALWQMDFKGPITTLNGQSHGLTVLDDHSRYNMVLRFLPDQKTPGVQQALTEAFRQYGLPDRMLMDNGSPWGSGPWGEPTKLTAWMMHIGIKPIHSRPYHPQTCGKDERFHRTMKLELLGQSQWRDTNHLQERADPWRHVYNHERPHDSLEGATPSSRYRPSLRAFPEVLPVIEYDQGVAVRIVDRDGQLKFHGKQLHVGKAFCGYRVGLRATEIDGQFDVLFHQFQISLIDLRC